MNYSEDKAILHQIIDSLWQYGPFTRDAVYASLSAWTHTDNAHVATMSVESARELIDKLLSHLHGIGIYRCPECKNARSTEHRPACCTRYGCSYFGAVHEKQRFFKCSEFKSKEQR